MDRELDLDLGRYRVDPGRHVDLDRVPTREGKPTDKDRAKRQTARLLDRFAGLQARLWAEKEHRVLVVLQATDTGGKDGTIASVFGAVNPQGLRIVPFKAPSETELAHDYLWRVHAQTPATGEIAVFNRSHYEDLLVVRVHDLVPRDRWRKRYRHIRDFERMLADEGTTIVKLFLHISKDEQRRRLQDRIDDPDEHWKFNPGDLAERERWDDYRAAYEDVLAETSTGWAPWYVIPADRKWWRNLLVASIMVDTLEALDPQYPPDPPGIAGTIVP